MLKRALVVLGLAACSHPKTITSETSIEVYDPIIFASGSDQVPANATKSIEAIATTMTGNPSLLKVSIEAHTAPADAATPADRQALAIRRAQAVLDQLVARGVERGRLQVGTADDGNDGIAIVVLERKGDDGKPEPPPAAY
jgi:outer membrane protein OmpA-like peptidoglycan-associated protein